MHALRRLCAQLSPALRPPSALRQQVRAHIGWPSPAERGSEPAAPSPAAEAQDPARGDAAPAVQEWEVQVFFRDSGRAVQAMPKGWEPFASVSGWSTGLYLRRLKPPQAQAPVGAGPGPSGKAAGLGGAAEQSDPE